MMHPINWVEKFGNEMNLEYVSFRYFGIFNSEGEGRFPFMTLLGKIFDQSFHENFMTKDFQVTPRDNA